MLIPPEVPPPADSELRDAMHAIEVRMSQLPAQPIESKVGTFGTHSSIVTSAALAGIGSRYLAVGSPNSIGIISCRDAAIAMTQCHQMLFPSLKFRFGGENTAVDQNQSVEEACASDIVCMSSHQDMSFDWIAAGTHLNIHDTGVWSHGVRELCALASITLQPTVHQPFSVPYQNHSLPDLVRGYVGGRIADEITVFLHSRGAVQ